MRINIITQPLFWNYGGILQNYALQSVLKQMGHDVLTINVPIREITSSASFRNYVRSGFNMLSKLRGNYDSPFFNPHTCLIKERELSFNQKSFIAKNIKKVDCQVPFSKDTERDNFADAWIVGSDQVWRPWCSPDIESYFFSFVGDNIKKIAYATSFGTDKWEINSELTERIALLAQRFDAISVREESGIKLCKDNLGVDVVSALDPTLLLGAQDYLNVAGEIETPSVEYIATYVLDASSEKKKIIKQEIKRLNLPQYKIGLMHKDRFDSIEYWLGMIAKSRCIITDSFHGTVFSIIFDKKVKILNNNLRGNARLDSLISMLKLKKDSEGYYYMDDESKELLKEKRIESLNFLKSSLS